MKRLFYMSLLFIFMPLSIFAISLAEINNNPERYKLICETSEFASFVDIDSIESLRYSPPFYTLKFTEYGIVYSDSIILEQKETINYDITKRKISHQKKTIGDYGIKTTTNYTKAYDFNGNFIFSNEFPKSSETSSSMSPISFMANYVFYKYYDEFYFPDFAIPYPILLSTA